MGGDDKEISAGTLSCVSPPEGKVGAERLLLARP